MVVRKLRMLSLYNISPGVERFDPPDQDSFYQDIQFSDIFVTTNFLNSVLSP